MGAVGRVYT